MAQHDDEDEEVIDVDNASPERTKTPPHPVLAHFKCVDLIGRLFKCRHCGWQTKGSTTRRKLEHLLAVKSGDVKPCPKHAEIPLEAREVLLSELKEMDALSARKKKRKKDKHETVSSMPVPQRQRKLTFGASKAEKDLLDMAYARMCFMSAVKSNFLDSPFTSTFFMVITCACL